MRCATVGLDARRAIGARDQNFFSLLSERGLKQGGDAETEADYGGP
jgi:hypothetical protein